MVTDLISTVNSNRSIIDLGEYKKFIDFLKNRLSLNDKIIEKELKKAFIDNKKLFKNVFKDSSSTRELAIHTARIYSNIYNDTAISFGYDNSSLKEFLYKLQYKVSLKELNNTFNYV